MSKLTTMIRPALVLLALFTLLTGVVNRLLAAGLERRSGKKWVAEIGMNMRSPTSKR